ncbi:MAG: alpha/beta hydrolase [Proteobacteria bacterium]|nr:alpha/beta hydrolase [Pseudomonadota bacterium]MBI3497073.1 alpha/beta hydrolase [Pseudomonadota bacterium]
MTTQTASHFIGLNGTEFHYVRAGSGAPLLLLHGWPEFWLTWKRVMERLADHFDLIAPDLRGFGKSGELDPPPSDQVGPDAHAADMLALLDALRIEKVGIVSHDVGGYVAQSVARQHPDRITGLFFFDCVYPGIGARWIQPDHIKEIWYQSFNQLPWAAELIGSSRDACRIYFGNLIRHWSVRKDAFDDLLEAWVDNFMSRGNLQGGFNWYRSANATRIAIMKGELPPPPPIAVPTRVLWGAGETVLPVAWADKLDQYFTDLEFSIMDGVGHFPHVEDPDRSAAAIATFFKRFP